MHYYDFDAIQYVKDIVDKNKYAIENGFKFCRISGIGDAEEMINSMRREKAFIAVDDTPESSVIVRDNGPVERIMQTVFVAYRFDSKSESSRISAEDKCKTFMLQFLSKILHDKDELKSAMIYLDQDIQSRMLGSILDGVTGLYFTFSFARPIKLCYNDNEWN